MSYAETKDKPHAVKERRMMKLPLDDYWKFPRDRDALIDGRAARILHPMGGEIEIVTGVVRMDGKAASVLLPSGSLVPIESCSQVQLAPE